MNANEKLLADVKRVAKHSEDIFEGIRILAHIHEVSLEEVRRLVVLELRELVREQDARDMP